MRAAALLRPRRRQPRQRAADWARRKAERLSGLASGRGVYDNIAEAYRFLMLHWRGPEDRIYCFGFSRGAFTARCVVGMVHLFGLLEPTHEVMLPTLIRVYFSLPSRERHWWQRLTRKVHQRWSRQGAPGRQKVTREDLARQIRNTFTSPERHEVWVHWVGVWDTVESVGLPGPLSRSNPSTATFVDKHVRHVRHALAFDEHRWTFEPRLYEEPRDIDIAQGAPAAAPLPWPQRLLRQRWFPGVHSDVGGGYPIGGLKPCGPIGERGLADETLAWMIDEVRPEFAGLLPFVPASDEERLQHDALWDTPWWALAGMCLRDMRPETALTAQGTPPQPIEVLPAPVAEPARSVWEKRRKTWPLLTALVLGTLCLLLSGNCLLPWGTADAGSQAAALDAIDDAPAHRLLAALGAAKEFALYQLAAVRDQLAVPLWTLLKEHRWCPPRLAPRWAAVQPAWAMVWDCAFAVCYGYLVARMSSRAFAWLAGRRRAGAARPRWRWLGLMPFVLVGGDISENLLALAALGWRGLGTDTVAAIFWCLGSVAALLKFAGALSCLPLLAVRLRLAFLPAARPGQPTASKGGA